MSDPLIEAIDEAARDLLQRAMAPHRDESGGIDPDTLAERVKAFEAVVGWAKERLTLDPPDKGPTKFEKLRSQFDGAGKKIRRGRTPAEDQEINGFGDPPGPADAGAASDLLA